MQGVRFRHHPDSAPVLDGFDLTVPPGTRLGLKGTSGRGKSTVLALLAGQIRPEAGQVTLGGDAVAELDEAPLRRTLTLVPQRSALIQGSVADNLRLGADRCDDDTLRQVLDAVRLTDALATRGGLGTPLGARGAGLSGGESRRLVVARALLRQPDILLLDEPTEGLDPAIAAAVLNAVLDRLPGATVIVASHRAQDLARMDRVIDLDLSAPGDNA